MKFDFPIEQIEYYFELVGACKVEVELNGNKISENIIGGDLLRPKNKFKITFSKQNPSDTRSYAIWKSFKINGGNFLQKVKDIDYHVDVKKHKDAKKIIQNNLYFGYIGTMEIEIEQTTELLKKAAWTIADKEFEHIKWPFRGDNYRTKKFSHILDDANYMYTGLVSPATPEINQAIDQARIGDLRKPLDDVRDRKKIEDWINRSSRISLIGMDKMKHFTFSQGVMDCINSFILSSEVVYMPKKTYYFQGEILRDKKIVKRDAFDDDIQEQSNFLLELPSPWYSTQQIKNKIREAKDKKCNVALDLTWLPAIDENIEIDMQYVDQVFFSMNKTWPIHDLRPAFRWSKHRLNDQQTFLNEYCSYTKVPPNLFMSLIDKFELDFSYNKYKQSAVQICKTFDLKPTSILWFTKHDSYRTDLKAHVSDHYFLDDFVCIRKLLDYKDKYFW